MTDYKSVIENLDVSIPINYHDILYKIIDKFFIYKLSICNFLVCLATGFIGRLFFGISIFMAYLAYMLSGLTFYTIHKLGHTNIIHCWYTAHTVGHHFYGYPSKHFLSVKYRDNIVDKFQMNTNMYLISGIINALIFGYIFNYTMFQTIGIGTYIIIFMLLENWIHTNVHIQHSYLNKYEWFQKLRYIHYLHHCGTMKQNYSVKDFILDLASGNLMLNST